MTATESGAAASRPETRGRLDDRFMVADLIRIGIALSAEKDLDRLLDLIVTEARYITNADGGSLYIMNEQKKVLEFAVIQNRELNVWQKGRENIHAWPAIPLADTLGRPNTRNVASCCALSRKIVNIADVYNDSDFDFAGTKGFDRMNSYRSVSMLVVPMLDHEDEIIGVLQLINARALMTGNITAFLSSQEDVVLSLASQAAVAINNARFVEGLERLLHAFVESIALAIDEKSPYTRGHIKRVAEITTAIATALSRVQDGPFAGLSYNEQELEEIKLAALLHDIGKIVTPEHVIDKGTKLEGLGDRIEVIRLRIEILKKNAEIRWLEGQRRQQEAGDAGRAEDGRSELDRELAALDRDFEFLALLNFGAIPMTPATSQRVRELACRSFRLADTTQPLLYPDELKNLLIPFGTLNQEERGIVNQHVVVTNRMLEDMPFPRRLRNVPRYAAMHHEKLNGSGYPHGYARDEIPLPARILAVADIFEALTAADRPYKNGMKLSESIKILESMADGGCLDKDVCDLFIRSGLALEYVRSHLEEYQMDDFVWNGCCFSPSGSGCND